MFKDPIAPKKIERGQPEQGAVLKGEFKAPPYDKRTSCSLSAGDNYGSGFRQPVGKHSAAGPKSGPIPQESGCFSPDEVIREDQKG